MRSSLRAGQVKHTVRGGFIDGDGDVVLVEGNCEGEARYASANDGDIEGLGGRHINFLG